MTSLVVFDDRHFPFDHAKSIADLSPVTDLRASFEVRTGILTSLERITFDWPGEIECVWVPPELEDLVTERSGVRVNEINHSGDDALLCLNGRWSLPAARVDLAPRQALVESATRSVVAAALSCTDGEAFLSTGELPPSTEIIETENQMLLHRPWHIIGLLADTLRVDLARHDLVQRVSTEGVVDCPPGVTVIGDEPCAIHHRARIYPGTTIDVENAPVVVDGNATVRPGAVIVGPAYIGPGSTVSENTIIKANTVIGPVCKVGGEVGGTVFQGYANKSHDGHLGDSYVGEWVNFGAGTTNSNLLNTYGEVVAQQHPRRHHERTGLMYLGAIIGDHAKFAINSRLMTGSVIGTGAMLASTYPVAACVEPFSWITDRQAHLYRFDKFIQVAETVFARRDIELTGAMRERLKQLHDRVAGSD